MSSTKLRVTAAPAGTEAEALIEQARRRHRRRRWLIAVAAAAALAVVAAVVTGGGGTGGRIVAHAGKHPAGAGAVPRLGVRWQAKVRAGVISITAAYGSLWVTGVGAVTRIDPASGRVTAHIRTPRMTVLSDAAGLDGRIWVSSGGFGGRSGDVLYEIDPATNRVTRTVSVPGQPSAMTAGDGYLWVDVHRHGAELRPFDPRTGTFGRPVVTEMEQLGQPAYGLGFVWVTSAEPWGRVWKVDPATMRASILLQTASAPGQPLYSSGGPDGVTIAADSVWLSFVNATEIARVSPATGALEQQLFVTKTEGTLLQGNPRGVWVLFQTGSSSPNIYQPDQSQPGRVGRIDPQANAFAGPDLKIGDSAGYDSFAASPTTAWVGNLYNSTVTAIGETGSAR
jgi:hypothetical protein